MTRFDATRMLEAGFPPGTPVRVREVTDRRGEDIIVETIGVVEAWEKLPTGSWYAHGKDGRLWLRRLKLRKADGEISVLVIDEGTSIAKIEAAKALDG